MISVDDLDAQCEGLPGVRGREYPFGDQPAVYKVGGKIFLLVSETAEPLRISIKHEPDAGQALREEFPQVTPGYHLNKRHWSTIVLTDDPNGLDPEEIHDLIKQSYELVRRSLPKHLRPPTPD